MTPVSSKKEKLSTIRAKLEKKEKIVQLMERKYRTKKLIALGGLFAKSGLDALETEILLGALLDLKQQSSNNETIKKWAQLGKNALATNSNSQRLIVRFTEKLPSEELNNYMKKNRWKWNGFRQEWYLYGKKEDILLLLNEHHAKAEITEINE
jgi:hypothetical protein